MASNEKSKYQHLEHGFPAYFDEGSRILILGSFPSVKSREAQFYYGHPQNRFWPLLGQLFNEEIGKTIEEKKRFLHDAHIALYDVIESCDIIGSSDTSIKNVVTTDIFSILKRTKIETILLNGRKSGTLFEKYQLPILGDVDYRIMPSTSPANAAMRMPDLERIWKEALAHVLN